MSRQVNTGKRAEATSYRHHERQSAFVGPKDGMQPQARSPWATGSLDMGPRVSHRVQPAQQAFFHRGLSGNIRALQPPLTQGGWSWAEQAQLFCSNCQAPALGHRRPRGHKHSLESVLFKDKINHANSCFSKGGTGQPAKATHPFLLPRAPPGLLCSPWAVACYSPGPWPSESIQHVQSTLWSQGQ